MIEEMREYVGEHHEAAGEPHLANAYPAQPPRNAGRTVDRPHIDNCRCQYSHVDLYAGRVKGNLQKKPGVSLRKKARCPKL
jgi:hypothetical protein